MVAKSQRISLISRAFTLEYFTIAWMLVEAVVAIGSGMVSVPFTRFFVAAVIGRFVRFFVVAGVVRAAGGGPKAHRWLAA